MNRRQLVCVLPRYIAYHLGYHNLTRLCNRQARLVKVIVKQGRLASTLFIDMRYSNCIAVLQPILGVGGA